MRDRSRRRQGDAGVKLTNATRPAKIRVEKPYRAASRTGHQMLLVCGLGGTRTSAVQRGLNAQTISGPKNFNFSSQASTSRRPSTTPNFSSLSVPPNTATMSSQPTSKTFGKSTRSVPHHSEKAPKWYPAYDEAQPRKVRFEAMQGRCE